MKKRITKKRSKKGKKMADHKSKTAREAAKSNKAPIDPKKGVPPPALRRDAAAIPATPPAKQIKFRISAADKKRYKKVLLELRDKVGGQISFLADDSLKRVEYDIPLDGGSEDFDRDFALNLLSSEHDAMYEINSALQRIEDGSFGRCEKCGNKIDTRRLDAVPFATMCIACQAVEEKDKPLYRPLGETLLSNNGGRATGSSTPPASDE